MRKPIRKPVRPFNDFLRVLVAPAIWFIHLVVVYGAEALICTGSMVSSGRVAVWTVVVATAAALIGLSCAAVQLRPAFVARKTARSALKFLPGTALALIPLSALAVMWVAVSAVLLPACTSPTG